MKDILRIGLEAFINQEEEEHKKNLAPPPTTTITTTSGMIQDERHYFSPIETRDRNEASVLIKLDPDGQRSIRSHHGPLPESNR